MTERSRFWDGTVTGDAPEAPYDGPTEFANVTRAGVFTGNSVNKSGVIMGELNELAVVGGAGLVTVDTGKAFVYGSWYENDASVNVAIPTPSVSTRVDRVVLRKDWAAKTVRITRIAGVEGAGAPAVTQIAGVTWDMNISQVSITTGGAITVTGVGGGERNFLPVLTMPACLAYRNAALSINNAVTTYVIWDSTMYESESSMWDAGAPTDIIVPKSGLYEITGRLTYDAQAAQGRIIATILTGAGLTVRDTSNRRKATADVETADVFVQAKVVLSAGDLVRMSTNQVTGGALAVQTGAQYSRLEVRMLQQFVGSGF